MPKWLKIVLIILVLIIGVPFLYGFLTAFNPKKQLELAEETNSLQNLKVAVSKELNLTPENIEVSIDKRDETGDRAVGTLTSKDSSEEYWWVGVNSLNPDTNKKRWMIVAAGDSKSVVACSSVETINYPTSLVPTCFDTKTQKLVTR